MFQSTSRTGNNTITPITDMTIASLIIYDIKEDMLRKKK